MKYDIMCLKIPGKWGKVIEIVGENVKKKNGLILSILC